MVYIQKSQRREMNTGERDNSSSSSESVGIPIQLASHQNDREDL